MFFFFRRGWIAPAFIFIDLPSGQSAILLKRVEKGRLLSSEGVASVALQLFPHT